MIKQTSIEAYKQMLESGEITRQQHLILTKLSRKNSSKGYTRQEISRKTGLSINVVCPRVRELLDANLLRIQGHKACPYTRRNVEAINLI